MLNWNGWLFSPDKTYVRLWSLAVCFTIRHSTQIGGTKAHCSYGWFGFNMNEAWALANGSTQRAKNETEQWQHKVTNCTICAVHKCFVKWTTFQSCSPCEAVVPVQLFYAFLSPDHNFSRKALFAPWLLKSPSIVWVFIFIDWKLA